MSFVNFPEAVWVIVYISRSGDFAVSAWRGSCEKRKTLVRCPPRQENPVCFPPGGVSPPGKKKWGGWGGSNMCGCALSKMPRFFPKSPRGLYFLKTFPVVAERGDFVKILARP